MGKKKIDLEWLRTEYEKHSIGDLARHAGCSRRAIFNAAKKLGLIKQKERIRRDEREVVSLRIECLRGNGWCVCEFEGVNGNHEASIRKDRREKH
jgi:hypothetical protein